MTYGSSAAQLLDASLVRRFGASDVSNALQQACITLMSAADAQGVPVRLSKIARHLGARIEYDRHIQIKNEEAALKFVDGKIVLWVSRCKFEDKRTRKRARFSIAHEIGHLILYRVLGTELLKYTHASSHLYSYVEKLCDVAGSHILIPRSILSTRLREFGLTSIEFARLLDLFDVSEAALFRAIADLVPRGAVIEWRRYRRHSAEPVSWRVWNTWRPALGKGNSSWLPTGCTMKHVFGTRDPNCLSINRPTGYTRINLNLNRSVVTRDAVTVLWPIPYCQAQHSLTDYSNVRARREVDQDSMSGRYVMLVGENDRVDHRQFGAQESEP